MHSLFLAWIVLSFIARARESSGTVCVSSQLCYTVIGRNMNDINLENIFFA
jgi:hypothetical protein